MRVLFAGTPEFAVPALAALHDRHELIGVYTQPDRQSGRGKKITMSAIKKKALELSLPIFQPQSLREQVELINQLKPDVFVVVAFGMILPQSILDIPHLGCLNIHGSILPRWRGAAPIQRAIEAGDDETGVSIMQMEAGLDTGPVFQILKTNIEEQDTSQTLHDRLAELGAKGICETLTKLEGSLNNLPKTHAQAQNDSLTTYAKKISKQEAQIDWQNSAESIQRKIRAFVPWPVCQTTHNDTRIRLWQSSVVTDTSSYNSSEPGEVIAVDDNSITISCGPNDESLTNALKLETLQRDGSKALAGKEFLNGYSIKIGDVLI